MKYFNELTKSEQEQVLTNINQRSETGSDIRETLRHTLSNSKIHLFDQNLGMQILPEGITKC